MKYLEAPMLIEIAGANFLNVKNLENTCFCCVAFYCFSVFFLAVKCTFPHFMIVIKLINFQSLFTLPFLTWLWLVLTLAKLIRIKHKVKVNRSQSLEYTLYNNSFD